MNRNRNDDDVQSINQSCSQLTLILITLFLLLTAIILGFISVMSPSWQIIDIREFHEEHHHGLWLDCTRAQRSYKNIDYIKDKSPLHCTYKFDGNAARFLGENKKDINTNAAAAESEHHQFYSWHKTILTFIALSLSAACLALCVGICIPCSSPCALIHNALCFLSFFLSTASSGIFFFVAHRVDTRFVQGLITTYEQTIGEAFYCYFVGNILLMLVFILSIIGSYNALKTNQYEDNYTMARESIPLYFQQDIEKTAV